MFYLTRAECLTNPRCATQGTANDPLLRAMWLAVWHQASRVLTSSAQCRGASLVMTTTLNNSLVSFSDVESAVDNIFESVNVNGPADIVDTALEFLVLIFNTRTALRPGSSSTTIYDSLLAWLFSKWIPSKFLSLGLMTIPDLVLRQYRQQDIHGSDDKHGVNKTGFDHSWVSFTVSQ